MSRSHICGNTPKFKIPYFVSESSLEIPDPPLVTVTLPAPDGIQQGDLLVAVVNGNQGWIDTFSTAPSGFVPVVSVTRDAGKNLWMGYKYATASEPSSYSWSGTSTAGDPRKVLIGMTVYRDGTIVGPTLEASESFVFASQPSQYNELWIGIGSSNSFTGDTDCTKPAGWTDRIDINANGGAIWLGDKQVTNGATGTATYSASGVGAMPWHMGFLYRG